MEIYRIMLIEKTKPWLVHEAIIFLEAILTKESLVLETGSGGSTIWFANKARSVLSFEHNKIWYRNVKETLEQKKIKNVDLRYAPDYPKKGLDLKGTFDVILIDGRGREKSFMSILKNLKVGGYLILDNAERPKYKNIIRIMSSLGYPRMIFVEGWSTIFWRKMEG